MPTQKKIEESYADRIVAKQDQAFGNAQRVAPNPNTPDRGKTWRRFRKWNRTGQRWQDKATKEFQHPEEALTARQMFVRDHLHEGRDDALNASKVNLGTTGRKFARMGSKEAFKFSGAGGAGTDSGGDAKWNTSVKLRTELAGEKLGGKMKSADKVGKVKFGGKGLGDSVTPEQVVSALLEAGEHDDSGNE
jgi:hypothetical protein